MSWNLESIYKAVSSFKIFNDQEMPNDFFRAVIGETIDQRLVNNGSLAVIGTIDQWLFFLQWGLQKLKEVSVIQTPSSIPTKLTRIKQGHWTTIQTYSRVIVTNYDEKKSDVESTQLSIEHIRKENIFYNCKFLVNNFQICK